MQPLTISSLTTRHYGNFTQSKYLYSIDGGLDKLNIQFNEFNKNRLFSLSKETTRINTYGYKRAFNIKIYGYSINIFLDCVYPQATYQHKVETCPRKWFGASDYISFFEDILGSDALIDHAISRFDSFLLLPSEDFSVDFLFQTMRVGRKTKISRFRDSNLNYKYGVTSGFTSGRNPHRIVIYDVDCERWRKEKGRNEERKQVLQTKLEVQISKAAKDYPFDLRLDSISKLLSFNPFYRLSFFNIYSTYRFPSKEQIKKI